MTTELKTCTKCKVEKPVTEFYLGGWRNSAGVGRPRSRSKNCTLEDCRALPRKEEDPNGTKPCKECGVEKPLTEFWQGGRGYRRGRCTDCMSASDRRRRTEERLKRYGETPGKTKWCSACGDVKNLADFYGATSKRHLVHNMCVMCVSASNRSRRYGVGPQEYEYMLQDQEHACKICRDPFDAVDVRQVHIDHCHDTGKVRGVLCSNCNKGLGCFRDNPSFLREAALHVEQFQGS